MSPAGKGSQGAMTLAPQQYAEQEATDALALAPLTDAQAADLIDHLPAVQPEVAALTNALQVFDRIPVGLGAHGPIHQAVERVRVAEIWADEDLYVFGEADEAKLSDEDIRNLLASYRDHAVTDGTGYIRQHTFSPLILIARPNPARPTRQRLLLLRDLATLQAARLLEWDVVEAIVYPDMSDFDIRNVGLHLALRATPPTRLEVLRQVLLMGEDWRRGRRAASSKRPSQTDLAAILGCSQSYISKVSKVLHNPSLTALVARQEVPVRVAIRAVEVLDQWPAERDTTIAYVVAERLATRAAEKYIVERAKAIREAATARQVGIPAAAVMELLRTLQRAARIAQERHDDLLLEVGDEAARSIVGELQRLLALLER